MPLAPYLFTPRLLSAHRCGPSNIEQEALLSSLLDKVQALQAQVDEYESENSSLQKTVHSLEKDLKDYANQDGPSVLQTRCADLEAKNSVLEYQCSMLEVAIEEDGTAFRAEIAELEVECDMWKQKAVEQQSRYSAFESQLGDLSGITNMKTENMKMKSELESGRLHRAKILERLEDMAECSVCLEEMSNPVVASCGHSFCRNCLEAHWTAQRRTECLLCRAMVTRQLYPALAVKKAIDVIKEMSPANGE